MDVVYETLGKVGITLQNIVGTPNACYIGSLMIACSSSLVAIYLACRSLQSVESETPIAGVVDMITSPNGNIHPNNIGSRIPRFTREQLMRVLMVTEEEEGCRILIDNALVDGDSTSASIWTSGVNSDGLDQDVTVRSSEAQVALIKQVSTHECARFWHRCIKSHVILEGLTCLWLTNGYSFGGLRV
jgi:hypothetical protein